MRILAPGPAAAFHEYASPACSSSGLGSATSVPCAGAAQRAMTLAGDPAQAARCRARRSRQQSRQQSTSGVSWGAWCCAAGGAKEMKPEGASGSPQAQLTQGKTAQKRDGHKETALYKHLRSAYLRRAGQSQVQALWAPESPGTMVSSGTFPKLRQAKRTWPFRWASADRAPKAGWVSTRKALLFC